MKNILYIFLISCFSLLLFRVQKKVVEVRAARPHVIIQKLL